MKVSVIIPNYNHAPYLEDRIESVLNQSFRDFELILLDDCSTDYSLNIIKKYRNHPKVTKVLINVACSGSPFLQWRKGLEYAQGEWVWFAESDDLAEPDFLEELVALAESRPGIGICYSDSYIMDREGGIDERLFSALRSKRFDSGHWDYDYLNSGREEIREYMICTCTINNSSSAILNRKILLEVNAFDLPFRYIGEWYVFLKMLMIADIAYCSKPLNYIRNALTVHDKQFEYALENFSIYSYLQKHAAWLPPAYIFQLMLANTRHSLLGQWNAKRIKKYSKMFRANPVWTSAILLYNLKQPIRERLMKTGSGHFIQVLQRWQFSSYKLVFGKLSKSLGLNFYRKQLDEEYRCKLIASAEFAVRSNGKFWIIEKRRTNRKISCRKFSSDLAVFHQALVKGELDDLFMQVRKSGFPVRHIIDAGSNIGLVALKIGEAFPEAKIWCIEPDIENFKVLESNLQSGRIKGKGIKMGLWNEPKRLYFDRTFRDGKEWSVALTEFEKSVEYVDSTSLNQLISENEIDILDLLKIDIEGAEGVIFNAAEKGLEFLDRTRFLVLEVHPECCSEEEIAGILERRNFEVSKSGEYLIGVNTILNRAS